MELAIRKMTKSEVQLAIELAAYEGWNPGIGDAEVFFAADHSGFLIGEICGKPIATISAIKYGDNFGFIGLYIVDPKYRGMGYGMKIWNAAMKELEGRNIGLDGVIEQQQNYKKSNFKLAYRNIRYEGITSLSAVSPHNIIDIVDIPFEEIEVFDSIFFPGSRTSFLKAWLTQPHGLGLAIKTDNEIQGYGVIRKCEVGYKVGPLFANTQDTADVLFSELKSKAEPGSQVYLDIPETNLEALQLVERHNMSKVFETARMYTGEFPAIPLDKVFGITSFELG